ncbi:hypothetical protein [Rhizobium mongolense]
MTDEPFPSPAIGDVRRVRRKWVRRNQAILAAACDALIRDVVKPRFLPEIRSSEWNYPVDIRGDRRGGQPRCSVMLAGVVA